MNSLVKIVKRKGKWFYYYDVEVWDEIGEFSRWRSYSKEFFLLFFAIRKYNRILNYTPKPKFEQIILEKERNV